LKILLIFLVGIFSVIPTGVAFASHIFDDGTAFAQYLDIAQLSAEKYPLKVGEKTYDIYYGYHGSFEVDVNKSDELPKLDSITINSEKKSLEVTMASVPTVSVLWLRLPFEVISAENSQYKLLIDGVDTQYDLTKFPNDYAIGMMMPKDAKHIEIIGTSVIPEFGAMSMIILGISVVGIVFLARNWTRIN